MGGPSSKKKNCVLDCLLNEDEEVESTVTISDEVDAYFEEHPIIHKEIHLLGGKAAVVNFLAIPI